MMDITARKFMMKKIKLLPLLLLFSVGSALAHLCPAYNEVYVNNTWVSSFGVWHKQTSFSISAGGVGWAKMDLTFTAPSDATVYCYYDDSTQCIPYKATYTGIATPSGSQWTVYDDDSYHCDSDRNTCSF